MYSSSLDLPAIEIIKGNISYFKLTINLTIDKLYWISGSKPPQSSTDAYYFNIDSVSFTSKETFEITPTLLTHLLINVFYVGFDL
jgi:hypothetical protein